MTALYSGSIIDLELTRTMLEDSFHILRARNLAGDIIRIQGDGSIITSGGLNIHGSDGLAVDKHASVGSLSMTIYEATAGDEILAPSHTSCMIIHNDQMTGSKNVFTLAESFIDGHLLLIVNEDEDDLNGMIKLAAKSTAWFLYHHNRFHELSTSLKDLHHIESLTASKDLNLGGNYSFTAYELRSSKLTKGRVPIIGSNGLLLDTEKLTYSKGVLKIPALQVDTLASDVDAKGSEIKNAVLNSAKIVGATSIESARIRIPGMKGVAYFDADGYLVAQSQQQSSSTTKDNDEKNSRPMDKLTVKQLVLDAASATAQTDEQVVILGMGRDGEVKPIDKEIVSVSRANEGRTSLNAAALSMAGDIQMNQHHIHDANIIGGSLTSISSISTASLQLIMSATAHPNDHESISLLTIDSKGKIAPLSSSELHINQLQVEESIYAKRVYTEELYLAKDAAVEAVDLVNAKILVYDPTSQQILSSSVDTLLENASRQQQQEATRSSYAQVSMIKAEGGYDSLLAYSRSSDTVGYTDEFSLKKALVQELIIEDSLHLNKLILPQRSQQSAGGALLIYDKDRQLMQAMSDHSFYINASDQSLHVPSVILDNHLAAKSIVTDSLSVASMEDLRSDGLLVSWSATDNRLGHTSSISIDAQDDYLRVKGIRAHEAPLMVENLSIRGASQSSSTAVAILEVHGKSDLLGDTYIEGSMTVRGTVIGSGPYIDSSDRRLKTNIQPLDASDTLTKFMKLRSVSQSLLLLLL
jgi:hypothetical protein